MKERIKQAAILFFIVVMTMGLLGCGSQANSQFSSTNDSKASTTKTQDDKPGKPVAELKEMPVGGVIDVETEYGSLEITVDKFVVRDGLTESRIESGHTASDEAVGHLDLTVSNISYQKENGKVDLSKCMKVKDDEGFTLKPMNLGWDAGVYSSAAGGHFECPIGEKMKIAVFYTIPSNCSSLRIEVGDYYVEVPVGHE